MRDIKVRRRPVDAGLLHSRMPVGAVVSILHRVAGVLLAALFPLALYALSRSLEGPASFAAWRGRLTSVEGHIVIGVSVGLLVHHLLAGVRHLLMDLDIGAGREMARSSAYAVLALASLGALLAAGFL
ncbi:MAG: succinate dehydrogenase, cytochrome b556 subunit [Acidiferrobacteraceae bacterium]